MTCKNVYKRGDIPHLTLQANFLGLSKTQLKFLDGFIAYPRLVKRPAIGQFGHAPDVKSCPGCKGYMFSVPYWMRYEMKK